MKAKTKKTESHEPTLQGHATPASDGRSVNTDAITVACAVTAAPPLRSPRVLEIAAMFGLGVDESREMTIVPPCAVPIPSPGIVFITGPSGSGKSTILQLLAERLRERGDRVIDVNAMDDGGNGFSRRTGDGAVADTGIGDAAITTVAVDTDRAMEHDLIKTLSIGDSLDMDASLIDRLGGDLREATSLLSLAGLGDAFVMLRREAELSDGQRFRFRLALAMEAAMSMTASETTSAAGSAGESTAVNHVAPLGIPDDSSSVVRFLAKTLNTNDGVEVIAGAPSPAPPSGRCVIIADEFAATLDRLTATTIARNVRRWIDRLARDAEVETEGASGNGGEASAQAARHHGPLITFIAATTHDDLLEPLHPDVLIYKGLGDLVEVMTR